ncbi:hypothetical protein [Palleronia rufa]|uniref:hypothetical protein n=1 Tax=Palleronia rufa TaxID=1530186 RepID=UPI001268DAA5|nr:hypothetical protein [Palleronia rufa]
MARLLGGESVRQVAAALDVAPSSVVKWSQRLRATGSCAPAGTGGHPPRKIAGGHEAWLLERITEPFTLRGLVVELAERGLKVDYRTVWAFVRRTGYSFKKRPNSPRSRTGPVAISCRPKCSFKPLFFRMRRGFSSPVLSGGDADCRSH